MNKSHEDLFEPFLSNHLLVYLLYGKDRQELGHCLVFQYNRLGCGIHDCQNKPKKYQDHTLSKERNQHY